MSRVEYFPVIAPPISYTWVPEDGQRIIPIVSNSLEPILTKYPSLGNELAVNGYLTDLMATATITSIPEAKAIEFLDEDTEADRLAKTLESKWESARIHLGLWLTNKESAPLVSDWSLVGFMSMQNSAYFPFEFYAPKELLTTNLAYELGCPGKIGLSVISVMWQGQELMLTATDKLTFRGSFRQEIHAIQPDILPQPTIIQGNIQQIQQRYEDRRFNVTAGTRLTLMEPRTNRVNGIIHNLGTTSAVLVKENGQVTSSDFTYAVSAGQNRALTPGVNGIITAISQSGVVAVRTEETYNIPVT